MTPKQAGWTVFIVALGMMSTLMSVEICDLVSWWDMTAPSFIGTLLAHFGTVIGAYVAGRLTPENRDGKQTRSSDRN
jgi:hypothetical protein